MLTVKLGGTLSGEHGVGVTKAPYVGLELGQGAINVMKSIKGVSDPNHILNPQKISPNNE
jgi:glycolate oxidase